MLASDIPISKTKITLPRRRGELLSRARLLDILYDRLQRKLVIISAAAGYGKTSLLIDLASRSELPFCWLALDPLDGEPQRFIAYFIAALSERFPQFGGRSRSVLDSLTSLEAGLERLLVTLINEIYDCIPEHFVLVLDDYHLLDQVKLSQNFVNRFIQLAGENCHLVLSSRTLPQLPDMPLLVAREEVGGLDFSDMAFRPDEIQALLARNRQTHISDEDAIRLADATEGWITALQFAELGQPAAGGSPFHASHGVGVSVFDFLGNQVLEQQPDELRTFLLRSSLLEEFDAALCEAALSPLYPVAQEWPSLLEAIVQKNLFALRVGPNGQWLRYHHLFSEYLQQRFRRECPEHVAPILQRVARYHESVGAWDRAYPIYEQLGDTDALADFIERAGIPMLQRSKLTLESWLKALPAAMLDGRAGLLSLHGSVEALKGHAAEGVDLFDRAIAALEPQDDRAGHALALARRGNALCFLGNYKGALEDAEAVIRMTGANGGLQWIFADALRVKGLCLYRQGQSLQAVKHLESALEIYIREKDEAPVPLLLMESGMIYSAIGNYDEGKMLYERALALWRERGDLSSQANVLNNLGFLHHQLGEYEKAAQTLEEGLLCAQQGGDKRMEALIAISLGDLFCEIEDFEIAEQNYRLAEDLTQQLGERWLINYLAVAESSLALLQEDVFRAEAILDQIAPSIQGSDSNYESGYFQLMRGRLALYAGNTEQAVDEFSGARDCFEQDGRKMESTWAAVWLAAAHQQRAESALAKDEMKAALGSPAQIDHAAVIATRRARNWLTGLQQDPEMRSLLDGLFGRVNRLDNDLPRVRRQLRRLARAIEVPAPKLIIHAFGPGRVYVNGKLVTPGDWQAQSVRELFFYLLARNRPLNKEQVAEDLWPDAEDPAKLSLRFKNDMYRVRRTVGQDTILFESNTYRFNNGVGHEYDVEAFQAYLALAASAQAATEQILFYQKALDLVQGPFLEDFGSNWVLMLREHLRQDFLASALLLAELYYKEGQLPAAIETCQRALAQDGTYEPACRLLMQICRRMGDMASLIRAYQTCEHNLRQLFNLQPSEETQKLYHELISG